MSFEGAKKERGTLRTRCTKLYNKLDTLYINSLDINELNAKQITIQRFLKRIVELDLIILDNLRNTEEDNIIEEEEESCDDYVDKLNQCSSKVQNKIKELNNTSSLNPPNQPLGTVHASNRTKLNLPILSLPKFHADPVKDEYTCQTFVSTLEQLLKCYNLNETEMYCMLEQQCAGRAKAMINSLTLSNRSYSTAKNILLLSFAEEVPQQYSTIKKIHNLKLKSDGDPYVYYAEFTKLIETAKEQNIDNDTFIQYHIWNSIPTVMQDILINVSQKSYPKLNEIKDSFLVASSRFEAQKSTKKIQNDIVVASHATHLKTESGPKGNQKSTTNQSSNKFNCCFCPTTEHSNSKCSKYITVKDKRERIAELKLCFRCLKSGHLSRNCNFKVNGKCYKCSRFHWAFLCENVSSPATGGAKGESNTNVNTSTVLENDSLGDASSE